MFPTLTKHSVSRFLAVFTICTLLLSFLPSTLFAQTPEEPVAVETAIEDVFVEDDEVSQDAVTPAPSESTESTADAVGTTDEAAAPTDSEDPAEPAAPIDDQAPATTSDAEQTTPAEPAADESTPAPLIVIDPTLTTDKADYAPTDMATIFGHFFSPFYTFLLQIVGGFEDGSEQVTHTDTVTTDEAGEFTYEYQLDGTYRPFYTVTALDLVSNETVATVDFTDSQPQTVAFSPSSSSTVVQGNAANYGVTVTMGGNTNVCTITMEVTTALPTGAVASFTGGTNPFNATTSNFSRTLQITTTNLTPAGSYPFTVRATRGSNCQGSAASPTVVGTLVVQTAAPTTASLTLVKNLVNGLSGTAAATDWTLTADGAVTDLSGVTGSGAVTNAVVNPGSYTLAESGGPTGYAASSYSCVKNAGAPVVGNTITLAANDTATCTITNTKLSSISGLKFKDLDADGTKDVGDNGLANWTITISGPNSFSDSKTTDVNGNYTFNNLAAGTYTVCETGQTGWIQTYPVANAGCHSVVLATGEAKTAVNFGNFEKVGLVITASSHTITYGDAIPTITPSYDGLIDGDLAPDTAATCSTEAVDGSDAGLHDSSCTGAADPKYNITYVDGVVEIEKADAVCDISGTTVTYDGNAHGATGTCTGVNDEELAGLDLGASFTNVPGGTADWVFTDQTGNYNDDAGSVAIEIGKANPTCTINGVTTVYDALTHGASGSCLGVDDETLADLDLGATFTNVPGGTANWTFTDTTGNYTDDSGSVEIEISKADAACDITGYSVVYDGDAHTATGDCLGVEGETLAGLNLSGTTHTNAGSYPTDAWTFTDVTGNYNDTNGTVADEISKADPVCSITGASVTYDGDAHGASGSCAGVDDEELAGLDLGDSFIDVPGGTANWTFTDVTGNYNNDSGSIEIVISKANPVCTITGTSVIYDAAAHGASGTCVGVDGEDLTDLDLGATFTNVPGGSADWTFTDATGNYNDDDGSVNIEILKADPLCTVTPYSVTYDGDAHTATGSCLGVLGEDLDGLDLTGTTHTDADVYSDTWTFTDVTGNYNDDSDTITDTIGTKALTITASSTSKQYSDPLPTFTVAYNGFVDGEDEGDLAGTLSCVTTTTATSPAGTYPITCSGLTSSNYAITYVAGTLTVMQENTAISFDGENFVITAGPTITSAPVPLRATLTQESDGNPGNIALAKVTFVLTPQGGGSDITIPDVPVDASGKVLTNKTVPVGVYDVTVHISTGNKYWKDAPVGSGTLTVTLGSAEQRVTGGGWVFDLASANDKDNFGFTVNYKKNGAPQGNFLYMIRGEDGYDYKIKSNSWAAGGLSFIGTNGAYFTAKATMTKTDQATGVVVSSDGSFTFAANIKDGDPTKTKDTFAITVFDSNKNVWKQLGTAATPIQLGGGNVVVHSK